MDGFTRYPVKSFRPEAHIGTLSFRPNGASAIDTTLNTGSLKGKVTVARTAAGTITLTLVAGMKFPERPVMHVSASAPTVAGSQAWQGTFDATNRVLTVYTGTVFGTAADLVTDANTWVHVVIHIINSTGK